MTKISHRQQNYLIKKIKRKIKNNQDFSIAFIGDKGSGKSWSAISLAIRISNELGNKFEQKDIVFAPKLFIKRIKEVESGKGKVILFDELQRGMSARDWYKKINKALVHAVEMMRTKNLVTIHTTMSLDRIDKNVRTLMDFCFHMDDDNPQRFKNKLVAKAKPFKLNFKPKLGKFHYNYLKKRSGDKDKICHFAYPSEENLDFFKEYEKRRNKLSKKTLEEVEFGEEEEERFKPKGKAEELVEKYGYEFFASDHTKKATKKGIGAKTQLSERKVAQVQFEMNHLPEAKKYQEKIRDNKK